MCMLRAGVGTRKRWMDVFLTVFFVVADCRLQRGILCVRTCYVPHPSVVVCVMMVSFSFLADIKGVFAPWFS